MKTLVAFFAVCMVPLSVYCGPPKDPDIINSLKLDCAKAKKISKRMLREKKSGKSKKDWPPTSP